MMPAIETLGSGFTRAKGTLPQAWLERGNMHIRGGANLRGYTSADIGNSLTRGCEACPAAEDVWGRRLFNFFAAVYMVCDFWNAITRTSTGMSAIIDAMTSRSYLFM